MREADEKGSRALMYGAVIFAIGSAIHNADHIRRGSGSVTIQLLVTGYAAMALTGICIIAVLERHRRAPQIAAAAGFGFAAAFAASHWLPTWSVLSDSFVDGGVASFSRAASIIEIVGALVFGCAGLYSWRIRASETGTSTAQHATAVGA